MKYRILDHLSKKIEGEEVFRIQAIKDFSDVTCDTLGGYISSEYNLSQEGDCWVYGEAIVRGRATVRKDAKVMDHATLFDWSSISDNAVMSDHSNASDNAMIYGNAKMFGWSRAYNNSEVFGDAVLKDQVRVFLDAWVYGELEVSGKAYVSGKCTKTPVVLMGLPYVVTIMDDELSFDCQAKLSQEWLSITNQELMLMDKAKAVRFYNKYWKIIKPIAEMHQKTEYTNRGG